MTKRRRRIPRIGDIVIVRYLEDESNVPAGHWRVTPLADDTMPSIVNKVYDDGSTLDAWCFGNAFGPPGSLIGEIPYSQDKARYVGAYRSGQIWWEWPS